MRVYNSSEENIIEKSVIALGSFDGLHIAHMQIMERTRAFARENNLKAGVLLFDRLPAEVFSKNAKRIMRLEDKKEILSDMDFLYIQEFSEEFMNLSAEEFAEFLAFELNAKAVCAGFNYRFGKNATGDIKKLREYGKAFGFEVIEMPELKKDNELVSSTRIRRLLENGDMKNAARLLGRDFFMTGKVIGGFHLGRTFGFPTVNLEYDKNSVLPEFGVYASYVSVENKKYKAVVNVGKRPTFDRSNVTIEAFLIDFDGDLYDKEIRIFFKEYLRPEIKFDSAESLAEQIKADVESTKHLLLEGEYENE